jgi:hypothetical protein
VTPDEYVRWVRQEFEAVTVPRGPGRRVGVERYLPAVFDWVRGSTRSTAAAVADGSEPIDTGLTAMADLALEITSLLYAAGADHPVWRHWAALAAFGLLLGDRPVEAVQYALLAGEEALAADVPFEPRRTRWFGEGVVWALATGVRTIGEPSPADAAGGPWRTVFRAVLDREPPLVELALHTIGELHNGRSDEPWEDFEPRSYPLFDPLAGAGAAVARRAGLLQALSSPLDQRYLEPGAADGDPEPLYPRLRPSRSTRRD